MFVFIFFDVIINLTLVRGKKMVITIAIDDIQTLTQGTAMSAYRFVNELKKRGHTVRVLAINVEGENMYALEERYIPLISRLALKQDIHFAVANEKTIEDAIRGSDVVHLYMPWKLATVCCKVAKKLGIPCTAGFHILPENMTHNAGFVRHIPGINNLIYTFFKLKLYKYVENIHVPTKHVANMIREHGYKAKLHIISNGISGDFYPTFEENGLVAPPKTDDGKIRIYYNGRLATEKRHDVLIKAISLSKYKDKILLTCAGKGPLEDKWKLLARKLGVNATFGYYTSDQIMRLIKEATLCVHAADIEVESIGCIEAFSCGRVIIVNNSKKTATTQFALNEKCLYKCNDTQDLANKIDYFLEHEDERRRLEVEYARLGERYRIEKSIEKTEEMFKQAISDNNVKLAIKRRELNQSEKTIKHKTRNYGAFFSRTSNFNYFVFAMPLIAFSTFNRHGLKIIGKQNLKGLNKSGAVTICNHVHEMDCEMVAAGIYPHRAFFTTLPTKIKHPVTASAVRKLGGVPVPATVQENNVFFYCLSKRINAGKFVHFYPEGEVASYSSELRPFKNAAFNLAVTTNAPIVPMRFVYRYNQNNKKAKPKFTLVIEKPIYPDFTLPKKLAVMQLADDSRKVMERIGKEYQK